MALERKLYDEGGDRDDADIESPTGDPPYNPPRKPNYREAMQPDDEGSTIDPNEFSPLPELTPEDEAWNLTPEEEDEIIDEVLGEMSIEDLEKAQRLPEVLRRHPPDHTQN